MSRKKIYDKENIVAIRKHLKLTQQKFAERINISRANLAKYETGGAKAPFEIIELIAKEFKFDVNDIYDNQFNPVTGRFSNSSNYDKKDKNFVEDPEPLIKKGELEMTPYQERIISSYKLRINFLKYQLADKEKIIDLQNEKIEYLKKLLNEQKK